MNLSIFARNLRGPYMIHPQQAAVMMPIVHGIISGLQIDVDGSEKKSGKKVACQDYWAGDKKSASPFSDKSVYVTYLEGTMTKNGSCYSYGTREIADELLAADKDPEIVGHIIVADSGGGAADSVPELAGAIRQLTKPVVGYVDGMAASACIYALSYTQRIIAHQPMDQVGCIGTMITVSGWPKFRKDSNGYVQVRIYADQSEEKNADYEAALEGNTQIIKEDVLNPLCELFIQDMKANRPNCTDDQLKGKTYFARDVVGTLIDQIGSFEDAVQAVLDLAAVEKSSGNVEESSSDMSKYPNLESIPELQEQVYAEDGSTTLQECQLEAIETALASGAQNSQAAVDAAAAARQTEVDELNQTIADRDNTIAQRDARIAELQDALDAALALGAEEQPASVQVEADPAEGNADIKPARNFAEAEKVCQEFLNRNN